MISKNFKCIYIHIPKTAGTSIEKKLGHFEILEHNIQDHRKLIEIEYEANRLKKCKNIIYAIKRKKYNRIIPNFKKIINPELTNKEYKNFFKFTIVRNSWSRIYSWYNVILSDPFHRKVFDINENKPPSLEDFIKYKLNYNDFSQLNYIKNSSGVIALDFIGRFENLQNDFDFVCDKIGIEDSTLPKLLVRKYNNYTDSYTDNTRDLIYKLYKEEIDYFGFEFGE